MDGLFLKALFGINFAHKMLSEIVIEKKFVRQWSIARWQPNVEGTNTYPDVDAQKK